MNNAIFRRKFVRIKFNVAIAMLAMANNVTRFGFLRLVAWLTHSEII